MPHSLRTGAKVHKGYYNTYSALKATIFSHVAAAMVSCPSCNAITVVGHSLGGALSTLSAFDLQVAYPTFAVAAWTTGEPKTCNLALYYPNRLLLRRKPSRW